MSAGLEKVRQAVADYLNGRGVPAVTAWPGRARQEREEPVVAVSVRGCKAGPGGLQNYLGERYGRRAELTLGLDIYAPEKGDGEAVQVAFDALAGALLLGSLPGLDLQEFSCGQTVWDSENRRLKRPVEAVCTAWLCAVTDGGGAFSDFELRGVVKE